MTPADVVKQRLQVASSPYRGTLDCVSSMLRTEGPLAFYRSLRTTLVMNVPFTAVHFAAYESAKKVLTPASVASADDAPLAAQLAAGGVAGGAAAALTTPLDVVKTRLQLEGVGSATRYGSSAVFPTLARIARDEGAAALAAGWAPRVLFHVPAAAVCWGTYETCKRVLKGGGEGGGG
jgi:solute carrier family 25 iron transporter 28/37